MVIETHDKEGESDDYWTPAYNQEATWINLIQAWHPAPAHS